MTDEREPTGEIVLYRTPDGRTRVECRFADETLWLSQALMAEQFQTTPQNVTQHLKAIFEEGELDAAATCKEFLQVRREGQRSVQRRVRHYRLEAILAVGYRVRSPRGSQFRAWATERLAEYLVKGFTMDDERSSALQVEVAPLLGPFWTTAHDDAMHLATARAVQARTAEALRGWPDTTSSSARNPAVRDRGNGPRDLHSRESLPRSWGCHPPKRPEHRIDIGAVTPGAVPAGEALDGARWNRLRSSRAAKAAAREAAERERIHRLRTKPGGQEAAS